MKVYYNTESGIVKSILPNNDKRLFPLNPTVDYIMIPDESSRTDYLLTLQKDKLRVTNGRLTQDDAPIFSFSGIKEYYDLMLKELYNSDFDMFALSQMWVVLGVVQLINSGQPVPFPLTFYDVDTGEEIVLNSAEELNTQFGMIALAKLGDTTAKFAKYAEIKRSIEAATTTGDFANIKF